MLRFEITSKRVLFSLGEDQKHARLHQAEVLAERLKDEGEAGRFYPINGCTQLRLASSTRLSGTDPST